LSKKRLVGLRRGGVIPFGGGRGGPVAKPTEPKGRIGRWLADEQAKRKHFEGGKGLGGFGFKLRGNLDHVEK